MRLEKGQEVTVTVGASGRQNSKVGGASSFGPYVTAIGSVYGGEGIGGDLNITGSSSGGPSTYADGGSFLCSAGGGAVNGYGRGCTGGAAGTGGCVIISR